jgi:predicted dehydrogenase/threonine dehydrogenase-like Zn-dependent dehydrogenase
MKQLVLRAGIPQIVEVPAPGRQAGHVLVASVASVISSGTERAAVASGGGGGSPLARAIRNPELLRKGLEHIREHGVRETLEVARGSTAPDSPLGYSASGFVLDTGGIPDFRVGGLVACAGAGYANHAETVSVPGNLVATVPEGVAPRAAAFTTLGAIALQGVRRAEPTLGERIVVVGLGLVGLIAVQVLRATGSQVLGVEPVDRRRELASRLGIDLTATPEDAHDVVFSWTNRAGADAVLLCAATPSSELVNNAVALLRPKGRLVIVGDVGLSLDRAPLYAREADVLISTSYGPGRYDPSYEEAGVDYPLAYVRWTENRNMEEVLRLLAGGLLDVEQLIGLELPLERAPDGYAALAGPEPPLATVLTYEPPASRTIGIGEVVKSPRATPVSADGAVRVALVGAGGFVTGVHLPNLRADGRAPVTVVANRRGTSASDVARRLSADATTEWRVAIERDDVDLVVIGTRHDTHSQIAAAALETGKAVLVEKPLGLSRPEIDAVWDAGRANDRLAIGFNRRFAALAQTLEQELRELPPSPVHLVYRVAAPLPTGHWLDDPAVGGGRLQGEACHMFDFANWLCGTPERVLGAALPATGGLRTVESASVTVEYENGSVATVTYSGAGADSMPKERIEVMSAARAWVLDDFRELTSYTSAGARTHTAPNVDKGHAALMRGVLAACRGEGPFDPGLEAAYSAQSVALAALEALATGQVVRVTPPPR